MQRLPAGLWGAVAVPVEPEPGLLRAGRVARSNIFNRPNFQLPNGTFGTGATPNANFGRPTAAADPRQIQFGLRLSF